MRREGGGGGGEGDLSNSGSLDAIIPQWSIDRQGIGEPNSSGDDQTYHDCGGADLGFCKNDSDDRYKTIGDEGITVDFSIIKVYTSN